jgi:hypothetical protein
MSRSTSSARAAAARRNGARSRGPKTAAGKARAARNALKHGLTARQVTLIGDEDATAFAALEAAAWTALAPSDAFQMDLVTRIVAASWRARRADRLEGALLGHFLADAGHGADPGGAAAQAALAFGLVRDGNGPRAFETLIRYRGSATAELFRSLGALRLLQADAQAGDGALNEARPALPSPTRKTKRTQETKQKQRPRAAATPQSAS